MVGETRLDDCRWVVEIRVDVLVVVDMNLDCWLLVMAVVVSFPSVVTGFAEDVN